MLSPVWRFTVQVYGDEAMLVAMMAIAGAAG
jgi:hypothetical protein